MHGIHLLVLTRFVLTWTNIEFNITAYQFVCFCAVLFILVIALFPWAMFKAQVVEVSLGSPSNCPRLSPTPTMKRERSRADRLINGQKPSEFLLLPRNKLDKTILRVKRYHSRLRLTALESGAD
jgi:hypothetical protein